MNNSKGFSLIEMVIVCLILVLVILITSSAFELIISRSAQLTKASKSNIEGIVGLELMRADLESAGFGLPWSFTNPISYSECLETKKRTNAIPTVFNDAPSNPPRAVLSMHAASKYGSDYLVVKSAAVGDDHASRKWSYIGYSPAGGILNSYKGSENLGDGDYVVTLSLGFGADAANDGTARQLVFPSGATKSEDYFYQINDPTSDPSPGDTSEFYVAYGISSKNKPVMPFNRVDYYVYRPDTTTDPNAMSKSCATGLGVGNLYRSSISHNGGTYNEIPLLNCVLDMQVYYLIDPDNDGKLQRVVRIPSEVQPNLDTDPTLKAKKIREQVKSIQVYILAQEGGMDRNFTYPDNKISYGLADDPKTWDDSTLQLAAGTNWRNYRWKVYTIVVQPKNLNK